MIAAAYSRDSVTAGHGVFDETCVGFCVDRRGGAGRFCKLCAIRKKRFYKLRTRVVNALATRLTDFSIFEYIYSYLRLYLGGIRYENAR